MNDTATISDAQLEELFGVPDLFLWQFDDSSALFVRMDRDAYHNSIFCDQRILATSRDIVRIDCSRLHSYLSGRPRCESGLNYIFHIAHCGSTLLARALDIKEDNIVYREPAVLRQLGAEAASGFYRTTPPARWQRRLELSVALLKRSYALDAPVIVKANVPVNFMTQALLENGPDNRALLLYSNLENYLLAVLKSANHRSWVAAICTELGPAIEAVTGIAAEQRQGLSIPEAAASLWMAQMAIFGQIAKAHSDVRTLDAEVFYGNPENTLQKCFEFVGQPIDGSAINEIVKSELFTRYSKDPRQSYDNETRLAQREEIRGRLAGDIDKGRDWINQHIGQCEIPSVLGNSLIENASPLLN